MSKFDYMTLDNEFIVNAERYDKEDAMELFRSEVDLNVIDVNERWFKGNGYSIKGERGAFPIWVIEFK